MFLIAIDQGTTSSRAVLFDHAFRPVAQHSIEIHQIFPRPEYVEHDPMELLSSTIACVRAVIEKAGIMPQQVQAIGIANQRETIIAFDPTTGKPIMNAIVWQCSRSAEICRELAKDGMAPTIKRKTGLVIDPYFSATKIQWIFENVPGAFARAQDGRLCFATEDAWLLYHLTGKKVVATDVTNASRTMLMNLSTMDYDEDLLTTFAIPRHALPQIVPSCGQIGVTERRLFGAPIPIAGIAGDQQASLFGHGCMRAGDVKNTYGTGCFLLMHTGEEIPMARGLVTTVAATADGSAQYALEGSVFVAGAAIKWLRDDMGILKTAAQSEAMAFSVPDTGGVMMVPSFTGLGAPYWDMNSRGMIIGLTRATRREHIVRAALESIAYSTKDVLDMMIKAAKAPAFVLKVDGGACANNFLMQFQADLLGTRVQRPVVLETTALGAAYLAGIATGFCSEQDPILLWQMEREFCPTMRRDEREQRMERWHDAVNRTLQWEK